MENSLAALRLFMVIIGCKPKGRYTEQHDVFFGVAAHIRDLVPQMMDFWPEAKGKIHIDAWREVTRVEGHIITVMPADGITESAAPGVFNLFFINLGGYKPGEFEEYHYKMLAVAPDPALAIQKAKQTAFFKHNGFKGARAHIDDKYGIDVDDIYPVQEILNPIYKQRYSLYIEADTTELSAEDELHIGYFKLDKL